MVGPNKKSEEIVDRHVCRPYANAPDLPVSNPAELPTNAIKGSVLHRCTLSPVLAVEGNKTHQCNFVVYFRSSQREKASFKTNFATRAPKNLSAVSVFQCDQNANRDT
jgi:hypothetical protein